jgi:hypothetical protein
MRPRLQKTEGGSGGKRGHSGMAHREYTEVIKATMDRLRRRADKAVVEEQVEDDTNACPLCGPDPREPEVHEQEVWNLLAGDA